MKIHTVERSVTCERSLSNHKIWQNTDVYTQARRTTFCGNTFTLLDCLLNHKQTHIGKSYQFDICGEFIQSSNVIIWHSYFCEKCDNLKKHAVYQNTISLVSKEMKQQNGGCTMYIVTSQIDIVYIQWKNKFLLVGEIGVCTL